MGDRAQAGDHPDDHERRRPGGHRRRDAVKEPPDRRTGEAADDHPRPEDPAGSAGADRERRREDLRERQRQHDPRCEVEQPRAHGHLRPAVAGADRTRQCDSDQTGDKASDRGLQHAAERHAPGKAPDGAEAPGVEATRQSAGDTDCGDVEELDGIVDEPIAAERPEDRAIPLEGAEERKRDDRGDDRRNQRLDLGVLAVGDLGAEDGAAERGTEDRSDPGADRRGDRDAGVGGRQAQAPCEQGREPRADLCGRPLGATGTAGTDGERRGDDLHEGDPAPDPGRVAMDRVDGGVGPVTCRLSGEQRDHDAADEPAQRSHGRNPPGPRRPDRQRVALPDRSRGPVAADRAEQDVGRPLEGGEERDSAETGGEPDHHPDDDPPVQVASERGGPERTGKPCPSA